MFREKHGNVDWTKKTAEAGGDLVVARLSLGIPLVGEVEVWDNLTR